MTVLSPDEVAGELRSGMTIGIGGWGSRRKPMALVRAILRTPVRDLTVVSFGGPDVGLLWLRAEARPPTLPIRLTVRPRSIRHESTLAATLEATVMHRAPRQSAEDLATWSATMEGVSAAAQERHYMIALRKMARCILMRRRSIR